MSTDRPSSPDGIGLPGWPSSTAGRQPSEIERQQPGMGRLEQMWTGQSSRQQERDARVDEPAPTMPTTAEMMPQRLRMLEEHFAAISRHSAMALQLLQAIREGR